MNPPAVLVVDDDQLFCESLVDYFGGIGVQASYVTSLRDAAAQPLDRFSVVVVDNHLPDGRGLALVEAATAATGPRPSFIMVTGDPSYDHAIEALRRHVVDYLAKPVELPRLAVAIERACGPAAAGSHRIAPSPPTPPTPAVHLSAEAMRYAQSDVSLLITGETGTGKTRLARALHEHSPRRDGPFVALNCAALPESLIDAELFGSRRGAFTGAADRPGVLRLAERGTLLLDEVAELPPTAQAKLLAVLEDRRLRPLGGTRWHRIDVRIIAATHVDLAGAVTQDRFRADLLYRLDVGRIALPPLRARLDELESAVHSLLLQLGAPPNASLASGQLARLRQHDWPGNYRELRNALARALVLDPPGALTPARHLRVRPARVTQAQAASQDCTLADLERRHLLSTLDRHEGHRGHTAAALGISEATLRRKLRAFSREAEHPTS